MICPECQQAICWVTPPFCPHCARPVSIQAKSSASKCVAACPVCSKQPSQIDGIYAAAEYEGVVELAVQALKYDEYRAVARPLADLLAAVWQRTLAPVDYLVPVPLHPRRLRERGYNQAVLLANALTKKIGIPVLDGVLVRSRNTPSQTKLKAAERRINTREAFSADSDGVRGKSVLLIDDVCTTGSTLQACASALKSKGADQVYALTVARARWDLSSGVTRDADHRL